MVWDPDEYREFRLAERKLREQNLGTSFGERASWKSPPIAGGALGRRGGAASRPAARSEHPQQSSSAEEDAADRLMRSSTWTGRRSPHEQLAVIRAYGPLAVQGAETLINAVQSARLNDPAAEDALKSLQELHAALGGLIAAVEMSGPSRTAWRMYERKKAKLIETMRGGAQAFLIAPVTAFGVATALSLLSGEDVSGEMLAILSGALLAKDAVLYGKSSSK